MAYEEHVLSCSEEKENVKYIFPKEKQIKFNKIQKMLEAPFCIIRYDLYTLN